MDERVARDFPETLGGDGPRATPTWHDGRLYALGATGELRALDASNGRSIWRTNILEDAGASNLPWGMSAAPLIVGDTVVVLPGGRKAIRSSPTIAPPGKSLVRARRCAEYSSPMLVTLGGVRQILVFSATRLVSLASRGDLLWEYPWKTQYRVNASQPLLLDDAPSSSRPATGPARRPRFARQQRTRLPCASCGAPIA